MKVRFPRSFNGNAGLVNFSCEFDRTTLRRMHQGVDMFDPKDSREPLRPILFPDLADVPAAIGGGNGAPFLCPQDIASTLNADQVSAVQQILTNFLERGGPPQLPYLVWGGPGTGKTTTAVAAIRCALRAQQSGSILIGTSSNAAADHITRCLKPHMGGKKLFRSLAKGRRLEDVSVDIRDFTCYDAVDSHFSAIPPGDVLLRSSDVVVTTLANAGALYNGGVPTNAFSLVLIDECSTCSEPESMALIGPFVRESTTLTLFGDHKQLGPVVFAEKASALRETLFGRLMERPMYRPDANGRLNPRLCTMLRQTYRSHPEILKVSNQLFYSGRLKAVTEPTHISRSLLDSPLLFKPGVPVMFDAIQGVHQREANSDSTFNAHEAQRVLMWIQRLLESGVAATDIGIITPYNRQRDKLLGAFSAKNIPDAISIGSVEMFQGQEKRVIIISTVRSVPQEDFLGTQHAAGDFVGDEKRFNVAVTRAQALLIVVGNPKVLRTSPCWAAFIQHCEQLGSCSKSMPNEPDHGNLAQRFIELTFHQTTTTTTNLQGKSSQEEFESDSDNPAYELDDLATRINSALSCPRAAPRPVW